MITEEIQLRRGNTMNRWVHFASAAVVGTIAAALGLALLGNFQPDEAGILHRWWHFLWRYCVPASITPLMMLGLMYWLKSRMKR